MGDAAAELRRQVVRLCTASGCYLVQLAHQMVRPASPAAFLRMHAWRQPATAAMSIHQRCAQLQTLRMGRHQQADTRRPSIAHLRPAASCAAHPHASIRRVVLRLVVRRFGTDPHAVGCVTAARGPLETPGASRSNSPLSSPRNSQRPNAIAYRSLLNDGDSLQARHGGCCTHAAVDSHGPVPPGMSACHHSQPCNSACIHAPTALRQCRSHHNGRRAHTQRQLLLRAIGMDCVWLV